MTLPTSLARRAGRHVLVALLSLGPFYLFLSLRMGTGVHVTNRSSPEASRSIERGRKPALELID